MKKLIPTILAISLSLSLGAQVKPLDESNLYSALTIPKELLPNANVVIRQYDHSFKVKNIGEAIETEHKIITILNEKGEHYASQIFWYDKLHEIEDIEAAIYDALGSPIRKLRKKDIDDVKAFENDITDSRAKKLNFPHRAYPYTIEYSVIKKHKSLLHYPNWYPQRDNSEAVQNAHFEVIMPETETLRFREFNLPKKVQQINSSVYHWDINNVKAYAEENFTPPASNSLPSVMIAPRNFSIAGVTGNMETWEGYGKFQLKLNEGRNQLTEEKQDFLKKLVADCPDDLCKIQRIYTHLQNTTRYVSIQLGIGGWQPMPASDVDRLKYGDCKALSNYMIAMLKVVGIDGRYVVIRRGDEWADQVEDFPNAHFNHVIACVPMKNDTLWLECTGEAESAGFLSDTDNRFALLVDPEKGGQLVRTPHFNEQANGVFTKFDLSIDLQGNATVLGSKTYRGTFQQTLAFVADWNTDIKKKYLYESLKINNLEIKKMDFIHRRERIPSVEIELDLAVEKIASVSGKRLFLPINVFSKLTNAPSPDSTRIFQVQAHDEGFTEQDSITFKLPEGFKTESRPDPLSIKSPFGNFDLSVKVEEQKITVFRRLTVNNKIFAKEKFGELVEFFRNVAKADKGKIVLVKTS